MSLNNKYADLPDIDTAPDIYETEDSFPTTQIKAADSSDEESSYPARHATTKPQSSSREELDLSSLISADQASAKFQRAENRRRRTRTQYEYPPSPDSPTSPNAQTGVPRDVPLSQRLRLLENELAALEAEVADPSNPLLQKEREEANVDPGVLIKGIVDVRSRLDRIKKDKEGRARLVSTLLEADIPTETKREDASAQLVDSSQKGDGQGAKTELQTVVELDKRVGELESLVGSSNASLDEASPIPTPLLPLVTRLNNQLTLLSQPRHIDAISRRLKLLLSDLERASTVHPKTHQRQQSQPNGPPPNSIQDQLYPLLSRLTPLLPQIPHLLTRLRSLSSLHTSAAQFQANLTTLEEEQTKLHSSLEELDKAVRSVEESLTTNRDLVKGNIAGLESRVSTLLNRLDDLRHET